MIAAWMLFATMLGLLLGAAAMAAEPLLAARRHPRRVVWLAALVLAILWPAAGVLTGRTTALVRAAPVVVTAVTLPLTRASAYVAQISTGRLAARVDGLLLGSWAAATLLLLVRLSVGRRRLERQRRQWASTSVDGLSVQLSHETGPAVVGVWPMEIVLPRWTLALDQPLRALVLRHEEEHRAARDPHLLLFATVAVALLPWNLALWWHVRRLRLAIEMDCDTRVLRAHPHCERYGLLLLTIAQRRNVAPRLATALSERVSELERRIVAMSTHTTARFRLTACGAFGLVALALACSLESPTRGVALEETAATSPVASEQPYREFRLTKEAVLLPGNRGPRYPDALRRANVKGEVLLQFVVDQTGRVDISSVKVLRSTDPQFTAATQGSLASWRFAPAEVNGRPVKQLVQMPFMFRLSRAGDSIVLRGAGRDLGVRPR
jgi:TonB family protein